MFVVIVIVIVVFIVVVFFIIVGNKNRNSLKNPLKTEGAFGLIVDCKSIFNIFCSLYFFYFISYFSTYLWYVCVCVLFFWLLMLKLFKKKKRKSFIWFNFYSLRFFTFLLNFQDVKDPIVLMENWWKLKHDFHIKTPFIIAVVKDQKWFNKLSKTYNLTNGFLSTHYLNE